MSVYKDQAGNVLVPASKEEVCKEYCEKLAEENEKLKKLVDRLMADLKYWQKLKVCEMFKRFEELSEDEIRLLMKAYGDRMCDIAVSYLKRDFLALFYKFENVWLLTALVTNVLFAFAVGYPNLIKELFMASLLLMKPICPCEFRRRLLEEGLEEDLSPGVREALIKAVFEKRAKLLGGRLDR